MLYSYSVLPKRYIFFWISCVLLIFSLLIIIFWNINLGIDMTWGTRTLYSYQNYSLDLPLLQREAEIISKQQNVDTNIVTQISLYQISGEKSFIVEAWFTNKISEKELERYKIAFRDELSERFAEIWDIWYESYTNIGASFGDYIKNTAKLTLFLAIIAIAVYIAYAFSGAIWGISSTSFALITLVTLFHDVGISTGLYIMTSYGFPEFQVDTFFVTALLTILWYSINDTIVVFDRIRSNLKEFGGKTKTLDEIIELSLRESYTRSIFTSLTLVFVLLCILFFGPESIGGFTLTMLFGTLVGTYSSLFLAAPLLYEFHKNKTLSVYIQQEEKSFDDTVVV